MANLHEMRAAYSLLGEAITEKEELQKIRSGTRTIRHEAAPTITATLTIGQLDVIRDAIEAKVANAAGLLNGTVTLEQLRAQQGA